MPVGCDPEEFGGSVKSINDWFHRLGYHLCRIAPGLDTVIPFSERPPLVEARFLLIATAAAF